MIYTREQTAWLRAKGALTGSAMETEVLVRRWQAETGDLAPLDLGRRCGVAGCDEPAAAVTDGAEVCCQHDTYEYDPRFVHTGRG